MNNTTQTMVAYLIVFEYDKYFFHEKCPISVGFFDYFFPACTFFLAVTGKNTVHSNSFTIHRKKRHVLSPQRSFYVKPTCIFTAEINQGVWFASVEFSPFFWLKNGVHYIDRSRCHRQFSIVRLHLIRQLKSI